MNERDLDAEFERIVAGWDAGAPDPTFDAGPDPDPHPSGSTPGSPSAPSEPDADQSASRVPGPDAPGSSTRPAQGDDADALSPDDPVPGGPPTVLGFPIAPGAESNVWRSAPRPHDDDSRALDGLPSGDDEHPDADHFVPPTETDLPSAEEDPMFWAIVVGLAGGPLLLFYLLLFDRDGSGWWVVTALAMIGVGFVLLVLRGGTERDPSDDGTRI